MSIPTNPMPTFTIPRNLSSEGADIQRALNRGNAFLWNVLEADQGAYFYQSVRQDGTVRGIRLDWVGGVAA